MTTLAPTQSDASRTASGRIVAALRQDILSGAQAPGTMLRQDVLAERFGASRIPVRDALQALAAEGLVELVPNRGASVVRLTVPQLREIFDLRRLLEGDLMLRAVRRMGPGHLDAIDQAMALAEAGLHGAQSRDLDDAFHIALYGPADRPRQLDMILSLRRIVRRHEQGHAQDPAEAQAFNAAHAAIVSACHAGDATRAARALDDHLKHAGDLALRTLA